MRYLLDTNAFLFVITGSPRLSKKAQSIVQDGENEIVVSAVSFWEIALKHAVGKLLLNGVTPEELPGVAEKLEFSMIGIEPDDAGSFNRLPAGGIHKDPFDRMLIWQALRRKLPIISCDRNFKEY
jgi:PIN domain nuclease of toxin-antitoxin system